MMTFFAPASRCLAASSRFVNSPVDSITTSAPASLQGRFAGSRSAKTFSSLPSTTSACSVCSTVPGKRPRIESYLSRVASVFVSVMSFTPTQSMSAPRACAARNTLRPMRPKPLMPACRGIGRSFACWIAAAESTEPTVQLRRYADLRSARSGPARRLLNVPVHHVHHQVLAVLVDACEVLSHHHGAVPPTGAADAHGEVGLALVLVGGEQVIQQRLELGVELADAVGALHVGDHVRVQTGLVAQVG